MKSVNLKQFDAYGREENGFFGPRFDSAFRNRTVVRFIWLITNWINGAFIYLGSAVAPNSWGLSLVPGAFLELEPNVNMVCFLRYYSVNRYGNMVV